MERPGGHSCIRQFSILRDVAGWQVRRDGSRHVQLTAGSFRWADRRLAAADEQQCGLPATWGKAESVEWINDGLDIQGWLVSPAKVEAGKKYPMVVLIHGGPSSLTSSEWPAGSGMSRAIIAALSSRGYCVLLPNPRGSYGQGEAFTRANVKDFGDGDLRDDLAGVDAAIKKYPIDPARLGVTGWSYGGFMTMWTVTQTVVSTPPLPAPASQIGGVTMGRT